MHRRESLDSLPQEHLAEQRFLRRMLLSSCNGKERSRKVRRSMLSAITVTALLIPNTAQAQEEKERTSSPEEAVSAADSAVALIDPQDEVSSQTSIESSEVSLPSSTSSAGSISDENLGTLSISGPGGDVQALGQNSVTSGDINTVVRKTQDGLRYAAVLDEDSPTSQEYSFDSD